jgi:hypothetical protein
MICVFGGAIGSWDVQKCATRRTMFLDCFGVSKKKNNMVMACVLRVLSNVTLLAHMLSATYKCHLFLLDIHLLTSTSKKKKKRDEGDLCGRGVPETT